MCVCPQSGVPQSLEARPFPASGPMSFLGGGTPVRPGVAPRQGGNPPPPDRTGIAPTLSPGRRAKRDVICSAASMALAVTQENFLVFNNFPTGLPLPAIPSVGTLSRKNIKYLFLKCFFYILGRRHKLPQIQLQGHGIKTRMGPYPPWTCHTLA